MELFLTVGVSAALRQLLEFGLFHGDPHPGNIFAMRDGRIAYVDFGNVAELSQVGASWPSHLFSPLPQHRGAKVGGVLEGFSRVQGLQQPAEARPPCSLDMSPCSTTSRS